MKKLFILLVASLFVFNFANAKKLQVYMTYATFYSPVDGPYVETYLTVIGNSVKFIKNQSDKFQGTIQVTLIFKKDSVIKDFKKYNLMSPEVNDTSGINLNFIDQQRFVLPDGKYDVEIIIDDLNDNSKPYKVNEIIEILVPTDKINISGIELVESYKKTETPNILSKSGYDLTPYNYSIYPDKTNKLTYYAEIYNTEKILGKDEKFVTSTFIEQNEGNKQLTDYAKIKKETAKQVNVVFNELDITNLISGSYNLVIEVRNKNNEVVAFNKIFFQRVKSPPANKNEYQTVDQLKIDVEKMNVENSFVANMKDKDTLLEFIKCLRPISTNSEKTYAKNLLKKPEINNLQQYFLSFWINREPKNPEGAWKKYYIEVQKVNNDFTAQNVKGYETDRGRVYLQYGPPNSRIQVSDEPDAWPYEIWHYYNIQSENNVKFVFLNENLSENSYNLIQSTKSGEPSYYKWLQKVYSRNTATNDIDSDGVIPHVGSRAMEYYNNPR
jgi:GWxTD domain-containing protein